MYMKLTNCFLLRINLLLGTLVGLLTGCSSKRVNANTAEDQIMAMYGIPVATYQVSGTVERADKKPLPNADVVVKGYKNFPIDTLHTNDNGKYEATIEGWPNDTLNFVATDPKTGQQDSIQVATEWQTEQGFRSTAKPIRANIRLRK